MNRLPRSALITGEEFDLFLNDPNGPANLQVVENIRRAELEQEIAALERELNMDPVAYVPIVATATALGTALGTAPGTAFSSPEIELSTEEKRKVAAYNQQLSEAERGRAMERLEAEMRRQSGMISLDEYDAFRAENTADMGAADPYLGSGGTQVDSDEGERTEDEYNNPRADAAFVDLVDPNANQNPPTAQVRHPELKAQQDLFTAPMPPHLSKKERAAEIAKRKTVFTNWKKDNGYKPRDTHEDVLEREDEQVAKKKPSLNQKVQMLTSEPAYKPWDKNKDYAQHAADVQANRHRVGGGPAEEYAAYILEMSKPAAQRKREKAAAKRKLKEDAIEKAKENAKKNAQAIKLAEEVRRAKIKELYEKLNEKFMVQDWLALGATPDEYTDEDRSRRYAVNYERFINSDDDDMLPNFPTTLTVDMYKRLGRVDFFQTFPRSNPKYMVYRDEDAWFFDEGEYANGDGLYHFNPILYQERADKREQMEAERRGRRDPKPIAGSTRAQIQKLQKSINRRKAVNTDTNLIGIAGEGGAPGVVEGVTARPHSILEAGKKTNNAQSKVVAHVGAANTLANEGVNDELYYRDLAQQTYTGGRKKAFDLPLDEVVDWLEETAAATEPVAKKRKKKSTMEELLREQQQVYQNLQEPKVGMRSREFESLVQFTPYQSDTSRELNEAAIEARRRRPAPIMSVKARQAQREAERRARASVPALTVEEEADYNDFENMIDSNRVRYPSGRRSSMRVSGKRKDVKEILKNYKLL